MVGQCLLTTLTAGALVVLSGCDSKESEPAAGDNTSVQPSLVAIDTDVRVDTDNTLLKGFMASPCGYSLPSDVVPAGEADDAIPEFAVNRALPDPSGLGASLPGLNCLTWKVSPAGILTISLLNQTLYCGGVKATTVHALAENEIVLGIMEGFALCSCCYDLSWTLVAAEIDVSAPINLCLSRYTDANFAPENTWEVDYDAFMSAPPLSCDTPLVLPLGNAPSGSICRRSSGCTFSTLHLGCTDDDACGDGQRCIPLDTEWGPQPLCLETCGEDADCPYEVMYCQEGLCRMDEALTSDWIVPPDNPRGPLL